MEEELVFQGAESALPSWSSLNFGLEVQSSELNCFLNPGCQSPMDLDDAFESPLSSIVSSPVASSAAGSVPGRGGGGNCIVNGEVVRKLGSVCSRGDGGGGGCGELSPQYYINGGNNSCYSTPLNSPPKPNLPTMDRHLQIGRNRTHLPSFAPFPADPGFAERAARFSSLGNVTGNLAGGNPNLGFDGGSKPPHRLISRVSGKHSEVGNLESRSKCSADSDQKFGEISRSMAPEHAELEASSISDQKDHADCNARKRKSASRGKTKETQIPANAALKQDAKAGAENEESNAKRSKSEELSGEEKAKASESCRNSKGNQKQSPEPQKDYIHVRARRGEATDSHSLAERVRREKISERMKLLQDLVPGCNKVTGKAVMLDEIINYVQSLQHQVEFLSMKLATLNPSGELNVDDLLSKDALRAQLRRSVYQLDSSVYGLQCQQQFSVNPPTASMDGFGEGAHPQASAYWQDDLQSVVQMRQVPQSFHGSGSAGQMKVEL